MPRKHPQSQMVPSVSGRRLTKSLFKQIPERNIKTLLDDNFKPTTIVNFFWGEAPRDNPTTLHILWQRESEFRRCRFGDLTINNPRKNDAVHISLCRQVYQRLAALPQVYL